jgi:hypothetical protein
LVLVVVAHLHLLVVLVVVGAVAVRLLSAFQRLLFPALYQLRLAPALIHLVGFARQPLGVMAPVRMEGMAVPVQAETLTLLVPEEVPGLLHFLFTVVGAHLYLVAERVVSLLPPVRLTVLRGAISVEAAAGQKQRLRHHHPQQAVQAHRALLLLRSFTNESTYFPQRKAH